MRYEIQIWDTDYQYTPIMNSTILAEPNVPHKRGNSMWMIL